MCYMKKNTRSAQYLCDFPDLEFEMPHKYWDWAGWNLGHLYVVEYDQQELEDAAKEPMGRMLWTI